MSFSDIKYYYNLHIKGFSRDSSKLVKLHILIFLIYFILNALLSILNINSLRFKINSALLLPLNLSVILYKPWVLITHIFIQKDIISLFFCMIYLYQMGKLSSHLLGGRRTFSLYITSAIFSGLVFNLILYRFNIVINKSYIVVGSLPSIYSLLIAISVFAPNYPIDLSIFGIVRLKNIAIILLGYLLYITLSEKHPTSYLSILSSIWGFCYIKFLQNGIDIGKFFDIPFNFFSMLFSEKSQQILYKRKKNK